MTTWPSFVHIAAVKTNRRRRKRTAFSHVRWTSYAIAAGATAVAGIPTAEAEIHYSGLVNFILNKHLPGSESHSFPLSQGVTLVGFRYVRGAVDNSADLFILGAAVSGGFRSVPSYATSIAASLRRRELVSAGPLNHFSLGRLQVYASSRAFRNRAPTLLASASITALEGNMAGSALSGAVAPRTSLY